MTAPEPLRTRLKKRVPLAVRQLVRLRRLDRLQLRVAYVWHDADERPA
jgi:hypothetical protein